jgi:hypothetical protein
MDQFVNLKETICQTVFNSMIIDSVFDVKSDIILILQVEYVFKLLVY